MTKVEFWPNVQVGRESDGSPFYAQTLLTDVAYWQGVSDQKAGQIEGMLNVADDLIPVLADLCDGMDHDDPDCPMDDTCDCANVAAVDAFFKVFNSKGADDAR